MLTSQHWPKAAASAAIFDETGRVLVGLRGKGPRPGVWSLPGGHIEPGETAREAALREVYEETAIRAQILGLVDINDIIARSDDGQLRAHYLLTIFYGRYLDGEIRAGDDCLEARFVTAEELSVLPTTEKLAGFVAAARQKLVP